MADLDKYRRERQQVLLLKQRLYELPVGIEARMTHLLTPPQNRKRVPDVVEGECSEEEGNEYDGADADAGAGADADADNDSSDSDAGKKKKKDPHVYRRGTGVNMVGKEEGKTKEFSASSSEGVGSENVFEFLTPSPESQKRRPTGFFEPLKNGSDKEVEKKNKFGKKKKK